MHRMAKVVFFTLGQSRTFGYENKAHFSGRPILSSRAVNCWVFVQTFSPFSPTAPNWSAIQVSNAGKHLLKCPQRICWAPEVLSSPVLFCAELRECLPWSAFLVSDRKCVPFTDALCSLATLIMKFQLLQALSLLNIKEIPCNKKRQFLKHVNQQLHCTNKMMFLIPNCLWY